MEVSVWKVFLNSLLLEGGKGGKKERVVCCLSPVGTKNALRTLPCCSRDSVHCTFIFTVSPAAEPWAALTLFLLFKSASHLSRVILRVVWLGMWVPFLTGLYPFLVCFLTWGMYLE